MKRGRELEREETIARVAESLLRDDVSAAVRLVEEHGPERALSLIAVAAREAWPSRWRATLGPLLTRIAEDAEILTDRGLTRIGFDVTNPHLAKALDEHTLTLAGEVSDTTRQGVEGAVRKGLEEGDSIPGIVSRIRAYADDIGPSRAKLIATDQSLKLSKKAGHLQARESGVISTRTWRDSGDHRVRPEHRALNGTTVAANEPYPNGEMVPGEHTVRCRCVEIFGINMEALRGRAS